jgi:putative spermidine/putrescine transport system permease protein
VKRSAVPLLVAPVILFAALILFWPLSKMVYYSFTDPSTGIANYTRVFAAGVYLRVILTTFQVSAIVTVICLVIGYPMAYVAATRRGRLGLLILGAVTLPFWTSLLVRTFAFMVLLSDNGVIPSLLRSLGWDQPPQMLYNRVGTVVGMVYVMLPFMVLTLYAVMTEINPGFQRAARSLGAPPLWAFLLVYVPQSFSGITGGILLVFTVSCGFYVTPALLGGRGEVFIAQVIQTNIESVSWGFASALAFILLLITMTIMFLYDRVLGRESVFRPGGAGA